MEYETEARLATHDPHEVLHDPLLAIAGGILMLAAIGWLLFNHSRVRALKRLAAQGKHGEADLVRAPRDIWRYPP